jgi:hypothetical protein
VGREFLGVSQCVDIHGLALAGFCEHGNEPLGSVKCRNLSYIRGSVSFWRRSVLRGVTIIRNIAIGGSRYWCDGVMKLLCTVCPAIEFEVLHPILLQ